MAVIKSNFPDHKFCHWEVKKLYGTGLFYFTPSILRQLLRTLAPAGSRMAINVVGVVAVIIFYIIILVVGLWAARRRKEGEEEAMLAGRNIGLFVGTFTMTGGSVVKPGTTNTNMLFYSNTILIYWNWIWYGTVRSLNWQRRQTGPDWHQSVNQSHRATDLSNLLPRTLHLPYRVGNERVW